MKLYYLIVSVCLIAVNGCKPSVQPITNAADYEVYLKRNSQNSLHSLQVINEDIHFWGQRLKTGISFDPVSRVKLAGLYAARFKVAGNIDDIHRSDSLYLLANPLIKIGSSSVYRALASNCVTQHKFQQAKLYIDSALVMGDDKYVSLLMQCDVSIELGNLPAARKALGKIKEKDDFDYLIREAKLLDHEGKLDEAILRMEKAVSQVESSKNDKLVSWAKTNLGDFYGHANRFKEAYQTYLDILKIDPDDFYALKGIAWLAFSHDKNVVEAKRILNHLSLIHPIPDYDLMLAKIADFENNNEEKDFHLKKFVKSVSDSRYGDMYNKYLFYLLVDENKGQEKALAIAEKEVVNRPTPQSFDLLAWAKFQSGKKDEALRIAKNFVENKSFEPDAYYHLAMIYLDAGNISKGKKYLKQAENSTFELGPLMANKIKMVSQDL